MHLLLHFGSERRSILILTVYMRGGALIECEFKENDSGMDAAGAEDCKAAAYRICEV